MTRRWPTAACQVARLRTGCGQPFAQGEVTLGPEPLPAPRRARAFSSSPAFLKNSPSPTKRFGFPVRPAACWMTSAAARISPSLLEHSGEHLEPRRHVGSAPRTSRKNALGLGLRPSAGGHARRAQGFSEARSRQMRPAAAQFRQHRHGSSTNDGRRSVARVRPENGQISIRKPPGLLRPALAPLPASDKAERQCEYAPSHRQKISGKRAPGNFRELRALKPPPRRKFLRSSGRKETLLRWDRGIAYGNRRGLQIRSPRADFRSRP